MRATLVEHDHSCEACGSEGTEQTYDLGSDWAVPFYWCFACDYGTFCRACEEA